MANQNGECKYEMNVKLIGSHARVSWSRPHEPGHAWTNEILTGTPI